MQFGALLLGAGFIAMDSVFAGPCKPRSSSTSEATTTTADVQTTATTLDDQTTIDIITTTTTAEAESTTTAAPSPSFQVVGGGGAVDGALLQGLDGESQLMMFNPNSPIDDYKPRTFTIERSTGRVKDKDGGFYICA